MKDETFHLSGLTVEDLFNAKEERRKRQAKLPFEEKIEIVKRLQSVSRSLRPARARNQRRRKSQLASEDS